MTNTRWTSEIEKWLSWLEAGATRPLTIELRRTQLRRVQRAFPTRSPWKLTPDDLAGWIAGHVWKPNTIASHRSALRSFYGWAHASGITTTDPSRLLRKIRLPAPVPKPVHRTVILPAMASAPPREQLAMLLGMRMGLRRGEIVQVNADDLEPALVGYALQVHGKGGKIRVLAITDREIERRLRALKPGEWAFPNRNRTGHLTPHYLAKKVKEAMAAHATTHQLRHRFATDAYKQSQDLLVVSRLLGHASTTTTEGYVATDDDRMREVMMMVSDLG